MPDLKLTELERRVLGHLPGGWPDLQPHIDAGVPLDHTLAEHTAALEDDVHAVGAAVDGEVRSLTAPEVAHMLEGLVGRGLAGCEDAEAVRRWFKTPAGYEAMHAPEKAVEQIPGPVELKLDPAVGLADLTGGPS